MRYSKGIMWLDDCRIPFVDENDGYTDEEWKNLYAGNRTDSSTNVGNEVKNIIRELLPKAPKGRFTPNLLVCDDMLNDGKTYGNLFKQNRNKDVDGGTGNSLVRAHKEGESNGVFDGGTSSSRFYDLDKWFDKIIDSL
jgi:serine/threonine protein kinase